MNPDMTSGGQAVVDVLAASGVDHVFAVPGESFMGLSVEIAAHEKMRLVTTRHEEGSAFMACAYSTLTRQPAVCMATRMVGAGHLAIGIHSAAQDSIPVIAIVGQIKTAWRHREAFQEAELATVFAPLAKWTVEVPRADRLAELTARALRVACSGRPGPVVLVLREDTLTEDVERSNHVALEVSRPAPDNTAVKRAFDLLRSAKRPALIVGGGLSASRAWQQCVQFCELEQIPVLTSWRRPDAFPNDHPLYLGWAGLRSPESPSNRLLAADAIMAVGTRLSEWTTVKYRIPAPSARLIHVDLAAEEIGGHVQADVPVVADAGLFLDAMIRAAQADPISPDVLGQRQERNASDRAQWEAETTPTRGTARSGYADQQAVAGHLRRILPPDALIVSDAGNFSGWPARYLRWNEPGTFLGPASGAMGYGVPAGVGAKLARPDKSVVVIVGDGGFGMTGLELETAVREKAPIVVLVYDNQQYGTMRMHRERDFPGRVTHEGLGPIDFAQLAESLGATGYTVDDDEEFPGALNDAMKAGIPAVIHIKCDPDQVSAAAG